MNDHFIIGLMAGYANTGTTLIGDGSVDVNSGKAGIYSTLHESGFYLDMMAAGGYNSFDTHRYGLGGIASGKTDGGEFDGLIGGGYDIHAGKLTFSPVASVQYTRMGINNFNETGSIAPMNIETQYQDSLRSKAGIRVVYDWKSESDIAVSFLGAVAWQHEYLNNAYAIDSRLASGAGNVFTVYGPELGRDSVVVNAGITVQWTERLGTCLYYNGELGRTNYQLNSVSTGVHVSF